MSKSTKRPGGGAATTRGIVYQLLWSILECTRCSVVDVLWNPDDKLESARVVLEPRAGGDLHTQVGGRRVVDQIKSRTTGRKWSLREVIEDVLPDLCKAASDSRETVYRFVTEGQLADWGGFWSLQRSLALVESGASIEGVLDDNHIIFRRPANATSAFWERDDYTERSLFNLIVAEVRSRMVRADPDYTLERSKERVRRVLRSFEVVQDLEIALLEERIDAYLLRHGAAAESVREKRDALVGRLASLASSNDNVISPGDIFAGVNLTPVAIDDFDALLAGLGSLMQVRQKADGYDPDLDVRRERASDAARIALETSILMVCGEPGNGKTWMSHAIGAQLALQGELVVRPQPSGAATDDIERAAQDFWEAGVRGDRPFSMGRLADRLRYYYPDRPRLLTVIVDDVQVLAHMHELVTLPWQEWRMGLVVLVSQDVAKAFRDEGTTIRSITIEQFTAQERERYLRKRIGTGWTCLPGDVLRLLKKPLLAALYCDLSSSEHWQPDDEYQLLDRYWRVRLDRLDRRVAAPARVGLFRLAGSVLCADASTSGTWSEARCLESFQGNGEALELALASGWLRTSRGCYEFSHDRLLNWCVARGLAEAEGTSEEEAAAERLVEISTLGRRFAGRNLGYVPMDLLWMVTRRGDGSASFAARLLRVLEEGDWTIDGLYGDGVRTLGTEAGPALVQRLCEAVDEDCFPRTRAIVEAASTTGEPALGEQAMEWLRDGTEARIRAAFLVLARNPRPEAADQLWDRHRSLMGATASSRNYHDLRLCYSALEACVRNLPDWIRAKTKEAPPDKCMRVLAALLRERPDGSALWRELREDYMAKMPAKHEEAIAVNVRRFGDREGVDWLRACLRRDDGWGPGFAFEALVVLDPDVALAELEQLPATRVAVHRLRGFHALLHIRGERVREIILRRIRRGEDDILLRDCFAERQNGLDDDLLEEALERLGENARRAIDGDREAQGRLERLATLLTGVTRVELLRVIESRQGSDLESILLEWLGRLKPRLSISHESCRADVLTLLARLGCRRLFDVVGPWLRSGSPPAIRDALPIVHLLPQAEAKGLLVEVALETSAGAYECAVELIEALASIGGWDEVMRVVVERGVINRNILSRLAAERESHGPLSDAELAPALRTLEKDAMSVGAHAALAISGRRDLASTLRAAFESAEEGSDLAVTGLYGYTVLEASESLDLEFLRSQFEVEAHRDVSVQALARQGTERALAILVEELERDYDDDLALFLSARGRTRTRAVAATWKAMQGGGRAHPWWPIQHLGELDNDDVRDYVRDEAYDTLGPATGEYFHGAIRALSAFDEESAFVAAERRLQEARSNHADHASYARLLLELDAPRAIPIILDRAMQEEALLSARILAETLASVFKQPSFPDDVHKGLAAWLRSEDASSRTRACRFLGWLGEPADLLEEVSSLVVAPHEDVAEAALEVVFRLESARDASELLTEIELEEDVMRRHRLLDVFLDSVDVGLVGPLPDRTQAVLEREGFLRREELFGRAWDRRKKLRKAMQRKDRSTA